MIAQQALVDARGQLRFHRRVDMSWVQDEVLRAVDKDELTRLFLLLLLFLGEEGCHKGKQNKGREEQSLHVHKATILIFVRRGYKNEFLLPAASHPLVWYKYRTE